MSATLEITAEEEHRGPARASRVARPAPTEHAWLGSALILVAAVGYTASNIYLRRAATSGDPIWVSCLKALPVTIVASLFIGLQMLRGQRPRATPRAIAALVTMGLAAQWLGNVPFQYALGEVGLALAVPLTFGTLIAGSALLGRLWLGEPLTPRTLGAMALATLAIVALSRGAQPAHAAVTSTLLTPHAGQHSPLWGVLACCLAGSIYAGNAAVIRRVLKNQAPISVTMLIISGTGALSLGVGSALRLGLAELVATPAPLLYDVLFAGLFNAVAFCAFTSGMKHVGVIQANTINTSQMAMAALAGVMFFHEPATLALGLGVMLSIAGMWLVQRQGSFAVLTRNDAKPVRGLAQKS